jgi:hypothetical protein
MAKFQMCVQAMWREDHHIDKFVEKSIN